MNRLAARNNLLNAVRLVVKGLEDIGIPALKGRDHREPGWREKQEYEDKLRSIIVRHFGRQRKIIKDKLTTYAFVHGKALTPPPVDLDEIYEDDDLIAELVALLQKTLKHGINLFGDNIALQIDWALTNKRAIEWALKYVYEFVKDIDDITRSILQTVINQFVEMPGMTIGDVMDLLPFDEERAQRIAVTEITRTYAKANQLAGEDLKKEFPDVRVVKTWFTNNDDLVCELCGYLNGTEVDVDEDFYEPEDSYQDGNPPRHVNCRCWTSTTTALEEDAE